MLQCLHHSWDLSSDDAVQIQLDYATKVECFDRLPNEIRFIAGVDVAYGKESDLQVYAAVVVIDLQSMKTVEQNVVVGQSHREYAPGLFAFRELPSLCQALSTLQTNPDLILCDGQGIAHPRRCGVASHLGLLFDTPTIGCAKTRLLGTYAKPGSARGDWSQLFDGGECVGAVLRTQQDIRPLFVSIGHRISLETARDWVLRLSKDVRQPETTRRANQLANEFRESHNRKITPC